MPKYCKNCGSLIENDAKFCGECGKATSGQSFLRKNNDIIIILAAIFAIAVVAVGAFIAIEELSFSTQEVDVGTHTFRIPADFEFDQSSAIHSSERGITYDSKDFYSDDEIISVFTISNPSNSNLKSLVNDTSSRQEYFGHSGYLEEDEYGYYFTFKLDGDVCCIYTNDLALFDEISII